MTKTRFAGRSAGTLMGTTAREGFFNGLALAALLIAVLALYVVTHPAAVAPPRSVQPAVSPVVTHHPPLQTT